MSLNTGDKLTHNESGQEAEYLAAVPTAGHGFLHVLKGAAGYILRLTGDLESEFSRTGASETLAAENATTEPDLIARFESMLRSYGLTKEDAAKAAAGTPAPVPEAHLSPDLAQAVSGEPEAGPEEEPGSGGGASTPPVSPAPASPPSNAIPL